MGKGFESNGVGLGSVVWETTPVVQQLANAGVMPYLVEAIENDGKTVRARATLDLIAKLKADERFLSGALHQLHKDVGDDRCEFRSIGGTLGKGSLQIVIDKKTGNFYADLDHHNPYQDVVSWTGHAGEVIGGLLRKLRRKRP